MLPSHPVSFLFVCLLEVFVILCNKSWVSTEKLSQRRERGQIWDSRGRLHILQLTLEPGFERLIKKSPPSYRIRKGIPGRRNGTRKGSEDYNHQGMQTELTVPDPPHLLLPLCSPHHQRDDLCARPPQQLPLSHLPAALTLCPEDSASCIPLGTALFCPLPCPHPGLGHSGHSPGQQPPLPSPVSFSAPCEGPGAMRGMRVLHTHSSPGEFKSKMRFIPLLCFRSLQQLLATLRTKFELSQGPQGPVCCGPLPAPPVSSQPPAP